MAEITLELKVSLEETLHTALKSAFQEIANEYGVLIEDISIDWETIHQIDGKSHLIKRVSLSTTTHAK